MGRFHALLIICLQLSWIAVDGRLVRNIGTLFLKNKFALDTIMKILPITDAISIIVGENNGRFPFAHSFLIQGDQAAVIDTGCGYKILEEVKRTFSVDFLINSHCHPDHTAGNWVFSNQPLYVPTQSADTIGRLDKLSQRLAASGQLAEIWKQYVIDTMGFRERVPSHFYDDGKIFDFGTCRLQAIHTPGHTADHYCFFEPENATLFSFDLDFTPFGPWYGNLESNIEQLRDSLSRIKTLNPQMVISSHTDILENDINEQIDLYLDVLRQREEKLLSMLNNGKTIAELQDTKPFYGKHPYQPELLWYWEGNMIQKHLDEMIDKGIIEKSGEYYKTII